MRPVLLITVNILLVAAMAQAAPRLEDPDAAAEMAGFRSAAIAQAQPTLEDRVSDIARELMCPVCAGQTVAESNSTLAQQMREEIRVRLRRGETKEQILAYFVGQFGESVLAAPPRSGAGLLLWIAPVLAFAIGVVIMIRYLRRMTRPRAVPRS